MVAVKSVGVLPKSSSPNVCSEVGTVQLERMARSLALSLTMAGARFCPGFAQLAGVPVVT